MSDFAMGAVIVGAVWLFLSVLTTVAWALLRRDDRRARRIAAVREQLRRETLAHALRQDVTL